MSDEAKDLVSKLLERNKDKRLGAVNDKNEILAHKFFAGLNTESLLNKTTEPPYRPFINQNDPYYVSNFNSELIRQPPRESVISKKEKERISTEIMGKQNTYFSSFLIFLMIY